MSEREDLDTDLTSYSLDDEDQLQPGDSLMGTGAADEDPLDVGYSPPDSARGSYAHGVTAAEQQVGETIDQRVKQEEPDTRWGDPDEPGRRGADRVGGDDPDSIAAEDDWIGDQEVGDARADPVSSAVALTERASSRTTSIAGVMPPTKVAYDVGSTWISSQREPSAPSSRAASRTIRRIWASPRTQWRAAS